MCNGGRVSQNYSFEYGVGNLTIEKAKLNISAVDIKREVGYPNPKFELEFDGFRNDDSVIDLDELPTISCEADILSDPGVYPIVLNGGFDNNYEYNLKNGQLVVVAPDNVHVLDVNTNEKFDVYNIHGMLIKKNSDKEIFENLRPGVYIIRQGKASRKIIID